MASESRLAKRCTGRQCRSVRFEMVLPIGKRLGKRWQYGSWKEYVEQRLNISERHALRLRTQAEVLYSFESILGTDQ